MYGLGIEIRRGRGGEGLCKVEVEVDVLMRLVERGMPADDRVYWFEEGREI